MSEVMSHDSVKSLLCKETCHPSTPTKIVAQINFDNTKLKEIVDEAVKRLKEEMKNERS